jgi:hypothetical protein
MTNRGVLLWAYTQQRPTAVCRDPSDSLLTGSQGVRR